MAPGVAEVGNHLQFPAERANVIAEGAEFGHGAAEALRMSAANHLEAAIVVDSARDPLASCRFDQFIAEADIRVEPVTPSQARIARDAYRLP